MLCVYVVRVCGLVACVCIRVYVRAYMFARTDECALLACISPEPYIVFVCISCLPPAMPLPTSSSYANGGRKREEEGGCGEKILKMECSKMKSKDMQDKAMLCLY